MTTEIRFLYEPRAHVANKMFSGELLMASKEPSLRGT